MHTYQILPHNGDPYTLQADSAVFDETTGAVSFFDGDSNLVARLLNVSFHLVTPPAEPEA